MRMTKGMKIFWIFIAVGLMLYAVMYIFDFCFYNSFSSKDRFEGDFSEEDISLSAEVIKNVHFGDDIDAVNSDIMTTLGDNMGMPMISDFSDPDFEAPYGRLPGSYASVGVASDKKDFPLNTVYTEFYEGKLLSVTLNYARQYSMDSSCEVVLERQKAISDEIRGVIKELGYVKKGALPYCMYESEKQAYSDNSDDPIIIKYFGADWINGPVYPYDYQLNIFNMFYNGYETFIDEGMPLDNGIEYYLSPDGKSVIALVVYDVHGNTNAFNDGASVSEHARFAPVSVVLYDLEMLQSAGDAGVVEVDRTFTSANNIEMYKELNETGAEELCEKYYLAHMKQ